MDSEKFQLVIDSLQDEGREVPTEVRNAIEDVFNEFSNIKNVVCYHLNDLEDFQNDIRLFNKVDIDMRGKHTGLVNNTWTYYGEVQHSLTEHINLVDETGVLEEISTLEPRNPAYVVNPADWIVLVWEKASWEADPETKKKVLERNVDLYIYAPYDDPYKDEEIREEEEYINGEQQ